MSLEEKFDKAVNVIRNLPKNGTYQPSHELQLRFYAFFKQATEGPNSQPRPSFWEVVKRAKWDAWAKLGNMTREEAMMHYIEELRKIVETMSYTDNVASFINSLDDFYDNVPAEDLELLVGPIIEKIRSRPNSPLSGSPLASRDTSPTRDLSPLRLHSRAATVNGSTKHITSSLETSPASSYSASPQPPESDDDDDDNFLDTQTEPDRISVKKVRIDEAPINRPMPSPPLNCPGKREIVEKAVEPKTEPTIELKTDPAVELKTAPSVEIKRETPLSDVNTLPQVNVILENTNPEQSKVTKSENCNGVIPNEVQNTHASPESMVTYEAFKKAITHLTEEVERLQGRVVTLEIERLQKDISTSVYNRDSSKWWELSLPTTAAILIWPVFILLMSKWMLNKKRH